MAVTKIWPIRKSFAAPIDYVQNKDKTANPGISVATDEVKPPMDEESYQALEDVIEYASSESNAKIERQATYI